jgi:hypothetical protein
VYIWDDCGKDEYCGSFLPPPAVVSRGRTGSCRSYVRFLVFKPMDPAAPAHKLALPTDDALAMQRLSAFDDEQLFGGESARVVVVVVVVVVVMMMMMMMWRQWGSCGGFVRVGLRSGLDYRKGGGLGRP